VSDEPLTNGQIAQVFDLLGDLLELDGAVRHRVLAYRRGASRVRGTSESVAQMALAGRATDLPDIGATLQAKIVELATTGGLEALEKARSKVPEGLVAVAGLTGIGPKRAVAIWAALDVTSLDGLEAAAGDGRLATVPGIGATTVEAVVTQIAEQRERGDSGRRVSLGIALPQAEQLAAELAEVPGVERVEVAGSLRRGRELVHDVDLVAATSDTPALFAALAASTRVERVLSSGEARMAVMTHTGIRIELAAAPPERFGNLLQHATGSARHNVRLREIAVRMGFSVSEHGITDAEGAVALHADEVGVYALLGKQMPPPELREDRDELDAGFAPPTLVSLDDLRGDLHTHSDWSDGRLTIAEMAAAARARSYAYLGVSDHSQSLAMTNGLTPDRVRRQWEEIAELNATFDDFQVLRCTEVDILSEGRLDFDDELLAGFDFVVASLHSGLTRPGSEVTARLLAAIDHPGVDAIGHPTARMLGRRESAAIDLERVVERAAATGTLLEINSQPQRLDLDSDMARVALGAGVRLLISSDAHHSDGLGLLRFGVMLARRAGAAPEQVANTRDWDGLQALLASGT
jgi:DNA polymerase (family X)